MLRIIILMVAISVLSTTAFANSFQGDWDSFWDGGSTRISIAIEGVNASGGYAYADQEGVITGTTSDDGKTLTGVWKQFPDSTNVYGNFIFFLSDDGNSFNGYWWSGTGDNRSNGGYWNAIKSKVAAPDWVASGFLASGVVVAEQNDVNHAVANGQTTVLDAKKEVAFHVTWYGDPRWTRLQRGTMIVLQDRIHIFIPTLRYTKERIMNHIEGELHSSTLAQKIRPGKYQILLNQSICGDVEVK